MPGVFINNDIENTFFGFFVNSENYLISWCVIALIKHCIYSRIQKAKEMKTSRMLISNFFKEKKE